MKYLIFVLFIITSPAFTLAQEYKPVKTSDSTYEITVGDAPVIENPDHPFNTFYYNTDDKPDGKLLVKTYDGKIIREAYYRNGKMGMDTWWFTEGHKQWEGDWQYINELKYYTRWFKHGSIQSQTDLAGLNTHFYENGNKKQQVQYVNGKKHGDFKKWYESGTLMEYGWYDNGTKLGKWTYYDEDGSINKIINYD